VNPDQVKSFLGRVSNPLTHTDIVSGENLKNIIQQENGKWVIELAVDGDRRLQLAIEAQIRTVLEKESIAPENVKVKFIETNNPGEMKSLQPEKKLPNIKRIILVGSGKGGVGKSTMTFNLAASIAQLGNKVGVLDADIYGPSIGKMTGLSGRQELNVVDDRIIPLDSHGLKVMSFSFLLEKEKAVVWRGPMLGKALEQLLFDVEWGILDYLFIDLPPGTGDTQLSLAQLIDSDGAILVTTPQEVAVQDAVRAKNMFETVHIPILGVIENMTQFICPHCNGESKIFGEGGGNKLAESASVPLLGQVPLTIELMKSAEAGFPLAMEEDSPEAVKDALNNIAQNLKKVLADH
jgi:ATP-binding protein involved in chromosome partitioning